MQEQVVRVHASSSLLPREQELAWQLAMLASDAVPVDAAVSVMVENRVIDNAAVAIAALNRRPVVNARAQALAHPRAGGATLVGDAARRPVHAEWASWANSVAVRELDFHDTFLAAEYAHPADSIPPLIAVAQQLECDGAALVRGILTAYEIHISLAKAISLHEHKIDHIAHLGPAVAGGIGSLLGLGTETIYQALQHALHVTCTTRQSRKGAISSWKAYAPAHAGKLAIEAVDRALRGEASPTPIYEGEDSVIAWLLGGPEARYLVQLPSPGEPKRAILESYTKAYSAEYQAQALIDLAFCLRDRISDLTAIAEIVIHTSHHTHHVIGTGSNDPQKFDPKASRETLDHSIMYILAVALEDGEWSHETSYAPARAARPSTVELWRKIRTIEDPDWTRRYLCSDPAKKAFGGRIQVVMKDGRIIEDEISVANAHPGGTSPFARADYVAKFETLTRSLVTATERDRFLDLATRLPELTAAEVGALNPTVSMDLLTASQQKGLFE